MKLLLINPYFGQGENQETEGATHSPPLGLGFVGTYIRDNTDWEVEIVDPVPQRLTEKQVLKKVKSADIVGLTSFADTRFYCFEFAAKVRKQNKNCLLIVGGPYTFVMDDLIMKHYPFIDILVRGEGEETLLEIVNGKKREEILGITYKKGKKIVRNPIRPLAPNIDKYYIDYSLLPPLDAYGKDIEAPAEFRKLKTISTIASRGCPFQCAYCANVHWERKWRATSPEELVRRIKGWVDEFGVEYIRFYDDLFTANKTWVLQVCKLLKKNKVNVKFRVLVRAGTPSEVLKALADAERYIINHPEAAKAVIQKKLKYGKAYMADVWPDYEFSLSLGQSLITAMEDEARWMISNGLTTEKQVPNFLNYIYIDGLKAIRPEAVNIIR